MPCAGRLTRIGSDADGWTRPDDSRDELPDRPDEGTFRCNRHCGGAGSVRRAPVPALPRAVRALAGCRAGCAAQGGNRGNRNSRVQLPRDGDDRRRRSGGGAPPGGPLASGADDGDGGRDGGRDGQGEKPDPRHGRTKKTHPPPPPPPSPPPSPSPAPPPPPRPPPPPPATGAGISFCIFIASRMTSGAWRDTLSPAWTATFTIRPGISGRTSTGPWAACPGPAAGPSASPGSKSRTSKRMGRRSTIAPQRVTNTRCRFDPTRTSIPGPFRTALHFTARPSIATPPGPASTSCASPLTTRRNRMASSHELAPAAGRPHGHAEPPQGLAGREQLDDLRHGCEGEREGLDVPVREGRARHRPKHVPVRD